MTCYLFHLFRADLSSKIGKMGVIGFPPMTTHMCGRLIYTSQGSELPGHLGPFLVSVTFMNV